MKEYSSPKAKIIVLGPESRMMLHASNAVSTKPQLSNGRFNDWDNGWDDDWDDEDLSSL